MITAEELTRVPLFQCLDEAARERLARNAADVYLRADEWLIREGEAPYFFAVLQGELRLEKELGGKPTSLHHYKPGDFFGEIPILMGSSVLVSIRATSFCRLVRLSPQQLQELLRDSEACSASVVQVMMQRLSHVQTWALQVPPARVLIVGSQYDTDCREIRSFLSANRIRFEWVDREREPERVPVCMPGNLRGPAVVIDQQTCLHGPSVRQVAEALGIQVSPAREHYDVVVIGGGPAGMAAGVYGASEGLSVLIVERSAAGGQAGTSSRIENYLGFPNGISGDELSERAQKQADRFGAEIALTRQACSVFPLAQGYCVELDEQQRVTGKTVIVATGVEWRRLCFHEEDRFIGRGVVYGASRMDANSVIGKHVYIVGGGNSAGQAAMFFSNYAERVTVLVRGAGLVLSMSTYLIDQLDRKCNVLVQPWTEVVRGEGEDHLESIVVRVSEPGKPVREERYTADALFAMIGAVARTDWLPEPMQCDDKGYICTGRDIEDWPLAREPFPLETSLPGVFAAGDVRHNSIKRVSSGVGEGSMAIAFVHQYLALEEATPGSVHALSRR